MAADGLARAPRNRTITLTEEERSHYAQRLVQLTQPATLQDICDRTLCQDIFDALPYLPDQFADLIIIDPPYNLTKQFNQQRTKRRSLQSYTHWMDSWMIQLVRLLKPTASLYICGDWQSSPAIHEVASRYFIIRNRITWEREKGRAARQNWKNCAEDIWFCTVSQNYVFNADAVRLKRRVIAPYTNTSGHPKDWHRTPQGNFRLTAPSNLWTDLTIPFWSMPENTSHPTQKPEKLVAKLILASSQANAVVFDPFLGSGTTSVVAKKLSRHYVGLEIDSDFACIAEKRLELANTHPRIQGYSDRTFWERNSQPWQDTSSVSR
ncbi:MAG: site-specific DNA-methyltransferase [Kaiparowitsia implicata GSE-PSE-MK54-09C]|nr:site-specific DNA-methyltransferase [Kaiparowitsia implicata GSE-PSE-MK54-09C]